MTTSCVGGVRRSVPSRAYDWVERLRLRSVAIAVLWLFVDEPVGTELALRIDIPGFFMTEHEGAGIPGA
jgi:hypothetical protein